MFLTLDLNTTPCGPPWQLLDLEAQSNSVINSFPHLEELRAPGGPEAGHKPGHLGNSLCNLTDSRRMVLTQEHLSRVNSSRW